MMCGSFYGCALDKTLYILDTPTRFHRHAPTQSLSLVLSLFPHFTPFSSSSIFNPLHFLFPIFFLSSKRCRISSSTPPSTLNPFLQTMSTSQLHNLVPLAAIATEDATGPNGSTATPEDDELYSGYHLPPAEIRDIVDAPPLPALSFSPQRDKILFLKRRSLPPLSEFAKPEDKLACVGIDGKSNSRSRMSFYTGIGIHDLRDDGTLGPEKLIHGFPDGSKLNFVTWSTDGRHLAFSSIQRKATKETVSPKIQSNEQKTVVQVRTFQDLLKDEYNEDLFEYYATSQLLFLVSLDGSLKLFGEPALYTSLDPSPDQKYILLTSLHRPFSFTVPCGRFPKKIDLWSAADGKFFRTSQLLLTVSEKACAP
ncbi:unnamed protein product [Lactuca saligna]|uniref:Uncharacterized protein n=1 Tax=Lactuca saligna TaxID=75948 RepID=A0AA35VTN1_LACSI|nr:unnamed protein product [Lactuca saligna]